MPDPEPRMAAYVEREAVALVKITQKGNAPMLAYFASMLAAEAAEIVRKGKG